jgi:hypothetical protein
VTVNVDYRQMGVGGDNSWGAEVHPEYQLTPQPYSYTFTMQPVVLSAHNPIPSINQKGVWPDSALSWSVSADAPEHYECYFGTDPNSLQVAQVLDGTATSYNPAGEHEMTWAHHYWWRLDEVTGNITRYGVLWDFFTQVPGDMDMDGDVGVDDLSNFAQYWLSDDLQTPANINRTGSVNIEDLALISEFWLFGM